MLIMSDIVEYNRRRMGDARRSVNGGIPNTKRAGGYGTYFAGFLD